MIVVGIENSWFIVRDSIKLMILKINLSKMISKKKREKIIYVLFYYTQIKWNLKNVDTRYFEG